MNQLNKIAGLYIATLRSIYLIHQFSHWTTRGSSFYSNHLLFKRLYESAEGSADLAAEKFLGLLGSECIDYATQQQYLNNVLDKYKSSSSDLLELGLCIESDFLKFSIQVFEAFKKENKMSFGLEDMLMSIASTREEAVYLLSQAADKEIKIVAFKKNANEDYDAFNGEFQLAIDNIKIKYSQSLHNALFEIANDGTLIITCYYINRVDPNTMSMIGKELKKSALELINKFNIPITQENIFIKNITQ